MRERNWIIEDIEYLVTMIDRWEALGHIEVAERDKAYLREKRADLELLRENGREYSERFKAQVISRVPVRSEKS